MSEGLVFKVLYAEDEDGIRRLMVNLLQRLPRYLPQVDQRYAPLTAVLKVEITAVSDGVQALAEWAKSGGDFDLVITDQRMPITTTTLAGMSITAGMAGTDLLKQLLPQIAAQETVLMLHCSGAYAAFCEAGLQDSPVVVVDKPAHPTYTIQQIVDTCRPIFDAMLATLPPPSEPQPPEAA